jgi:hypothetical protein
MPILVSGLRHSLGIESRQRKRAEFRVACCPDAHGQDEAVSKARSAAKSLPPLVTTHDLRTINIEDLWNTQSIEPGQSGPRNIQHCGNSHTFFEITSLEKSR